MGMQDLVLKQEDVNAMELGLDRSLLVIVGFYHLVCTGIRFTNTYYWRVMLPVLFMILEDESV